MELHARKSEGFVQTATASIIHFLDRSRRKVLGFLAASALLATVCAAPVAGQSVQFFGSFQYYNQSFAQNAQGLVANAQGEIYLSGSHALGYVPVDVNGVPVESQEAGIPGPSQGHVMGMAIDASNNIFRADPDSPNGAAVEMFSYLGSPTSFGFSYIGAGWVEPTSVTTDSLSNVYVLDGGAGTIVELTPNGLGGYSQTTLFSDPGLLSTTGLAIDSAGNFYVASGTNYGAYPIAAPSQTAVYKITNNGDGTYTLSTIGGSNWSSPSATSVDAAGNVWVVDCGLEVNCGAGTINLLVAAGGGSYNAPIVYQTIPGIRTLMINQAGKIYGFGYNGAEALIWTGGTPPHNLGTYAVGTSAPVTTATVDFMVGATAGGFNVTTQGASAGDFQFTNGGTCAAGSYVASQSCTVEVTFTPKAPGMRTGALVVTDGNGNVLGTNYFYGVGLAPSLAFQPGTFSAPIPNGSGLHAPFGAAFDQAGNLYVTDNNLNTLFKYAPGSPTGIPVDSSFQGLGVAVDGAGNVWAADCSDSEVVLETLTGPSTYTKSAPFTGLACPYDVAVDGSGNVYIANSGAGSILKETLSNGSYVQSIVVSGLGSSNAVKVDNNGDVYLTDPNNNQVLEEIPSGNSYTQTVVASSGLNSPDGLAVDPNGNVYISDSGNSRIVEATPSGATFNQSTLLSNTGLSYPVGLALDPVGDLYIVDQVGAAIDELNISTTPTFAFPTTVAGSESSPMSTILFNYGNAALNVSTISIPAGFATDSSTVCALSSGSLAANTSCLLGIDFTPSSGVPYVDSTVITDNNLNVPATTQTISLSGAGVLITLSPASETLPAGTVGVAYSQTFSADGGTSSYTYALTVTSGAMPAGLSFSGGVLSGTPLTSGLVSFSIVATDSSSSPGPYSSSSQSFTLSIAQGTATVTLGGLSQAYTGSPIAATATTSPASLGVTLSYSQNGSPVATPTAAGSYAVTATVTDPNYTGTATGTLLIGQAAATIALSGLSQTYTGSALAATATTTPASLNVSMTYNGSPTAPTAAGTYAVVATITDPNYTGTTTGTELISQAAATIALSGLSQTYTGSGLAATATTTPASLSVSMTYNGSPTAPTAAGNYVVVGTITDPNYTGTASGSMTINKATATVTLAGLSQAYTGSALTASAITTPAGLNVALSYNGSATVPTAAGTYVVVGTVTDPNYTGTASGSMMINKAAATVTLAGLSQTYTGSAIAATATTNPASLSVAMTYNGSSIVPTAAGIYAVVGTISDPNYSGTASGAMTISKAAARVTLSRLSQTYSGSALAVTVATNPVGLDVALTYNGSSTAPTAAGNYAVVGTITDPNYTGTASGTLVIGTAATAVTVASSANPAVLMNTVTLTATVSSAAGAPVGQVSFLDGTTPLGSATVSGGVATLATATLAAGAHSITATYIPNADFAASSSSALSMTIVDLSVGNTGSAGAGSTTQTTSPGGAATYTVALAPSTGTTFPSPITLTVTGLPVGATATLGTPGWTEQSLTSWTLPANQPVKNISLTLTAPTQMAAGKPNDGPGRKLPLVAMAMLLLPFARKWRKASKRMNGWLCLMLMVAGLTAAAGATGCGSSSSAPQTYNVTVTVTAGALSHSTPLTLNVK